MDTVVRIKEIDAKKTKVKIKKKGDKYVAVFTPIDSKDNYLGAGYGHLIKVEAKGATLDGMLKDNLKGSYEQALKPIKGEKGIVVINVLGAKIEKPLTTPPPWWIIVLVIAAVIVILVLVLRKKK
jgi:hypothetical protein